jgi:hypothetical protein
MAKNRPSSISSWKGRRRSVTPFISSISGQKAGAAAVKTGP